MADPAPKPKPKHRLNKSRKGPYSVLIGPYDEEVIAAIKTLPARARAWDALLKAWKIDESHHDEAQRLIDEVYDGR